jgi:hypothetical protein
MAGGTIFSKTISFVQGGADKSLIINANYAYVAPFTFETGWNEIQIGVLMSFVKAGLNGFCILWNNCIRNR